MSSNIYGNLFDNVPLPNNIINNKAILYLFTPRKINNHVIRPIQYSFTPGYIELLSEELTKSGVTDSIIKSDISKSVILPSSTPLIHNTSIFSDKWTFVLILDGECVNLNNINNDEVVNLEIIKPKNIRIIYTGFLLDEPINLNQLNTNITNPTINHNCHLVITKKIIYRKPITPERYHINKLSASILSNEPFSQGQIVIPSSFDQYSKIDSSNLIPLDPPNLIDNNSVIDNNENQSYFVNDGSNSILFNPVMNNAFVDPNKHLNVITKSLESAYSSLLFNTENNNYLFVDDVLANDIQENIKSYSSKYQSTIYNDFGLSENSPYTLSFIDDVYNPEIIIVKNDNRNYLSIADGITTTPETAYSSLLESIIPYYLLECSIASISFIYDSYSNYFEILNIEAIDNIPESTLEILVNRFINKLKEDIFPILRLNCGDFMIRITSSIYHNTLINIKFYDFNKYLGDDDYLENVNVIIPQTNNIGTPDIANNNYNNVMSLIKYASSTSADEI